jgi:hypothetical protein
MTKVYLKNMPKLKLGDLLRRRKMSLKQLLGEFGITTYEGLVIRCDRMGVLAPTLDEFKLAFDTGPVNSPTEGVVVLEPPPVIDEISGRKIDPEAPVIPGVFVITETHDVVEDVEETLSVEPTEPTQKKTRKKKEAIQAE